MIKAEEKFPYPSNILNSMLIYSPSTNKEEPVLTGSFVSYFALGKCFMALKQCLTENKTYAKSFRF